jgi:hypothetical protein
VFGETQDQPELPGRIFRSGSSHSIGRLDNVPDDYFAGSVLQFILNGSGNKPRQSERQQEESGQASC